MAIVNLVSVHGRESRRGFTLIALLSTLFIGSLLTFVLLHGLGSARAKSLQLRCAVNLKQLEMAARMYAQDEGRGRFPDCTGAVWPWDVPGPAVNGLMRHGATRDAFYCPAFPEQNADELWLFTAGTSGTSGFRVTGYAFAFKGAGRVRVTNVTESLSPAPYRIGSTEFQPRPSERVLSGDATLSVGSNETQRSANRYTGVVGGWRLPHRAAHLTGTMPSGANLVFLDGHAEWRPFRKMRVRTDGDPSFWW